MLIEPMIKQLTALKLHGMAQSLEQTLTQSDMDFAARLTLMLEHEQAARSSHRLSQRLRFAKLPQTACVEDLDLRTPRNIDTNTLTHLMGMSFIREHLNVLVCGPTGVGKSYLASAIAHSACRHDYAVRCFRLPRLAEELARYSAQQKRSAFLRQLAKADLLLIDDFGLTPMSDQTKRDLLEILDDRYDKKSTIITSQLPVDQWHTYLAEPTLADAILDRLVHNSYRLNLKGASMRKQKAVTPIEPAKAKTKP
jgi:DNA replication protein DnaC